MSSFQPLQLSSWFQNINELAEEFMETDKTGFLLFRNFNHNSLLSNHINSILSKGQIKF